MKVHEKINYIELPSKNIIKTKIFFKKVFGWKFVDYGKEYIAFSNEGIDGGFFSSNKSTRVKNGSALVVFYSKCLENTEEKIKKSGGEIVQTIFSFPGGRRFHFTDPNGNEYAVWSDK